jgi:16S rRNA processing protein RimM
VELALFGYFTKTHGVKGQLVLKQEADVDLAALKSVFLESAGARVPYFIRSVSETGKGLIVTLEEIDSVEKARLLTGKKVMVDEKLILEEEEEAEWTGYELIDSRHGSLGKILSVADNGVQLLFTLQHKGKEIMLPFVEEFVDRIDEEKKVIYYTAPEGLISLYL